MASKFQTRPSEFLGISHTVEAFFFDKAVFYFGSTVDADIQEHSKSRSSKTPDKPELTKLKQEMRLAKWLNTDGDGKRKFRDPNLEMRR